MENIKEILLTALFIGAIWHTKVAFSSETTMTGVFQEQPEIGYVWRNTEGVSKRFFWEDTKVIWQEGQVHPSYNVQASNQVGIWTPLIGYVFTNESKGDLSTIWKSGIKHPDMNAFSSENEGRWIPALGYKFVMENDVAINTTWDAGRRYDNFKIFAGQETDTYFPYAGYQFVDPQTNLEVVWTPGTFDPNNYNLIAGLTEGSWESRSYVSPEPTAGEHIENAVAGGLTAKVIEWLFGENAVSDKIYEESTKEGIKGIAKSFK
jgi:hypothetical protein